MRRDLLRDTINALKLRVKLLFSRGRVSYVYAQEPGLLRKLQTRGLDLVDGVDHAEPYGLAVHPLAGAEAFLSATLGQRGHLVATIVGDSRYQPSDHAPGEVIVYSFAGQRIWLKADGSLSISAPGPIRISAPKVEVTAPDVEVTATNVTIAAQKARLDCDDIAFGGEGGQPVARVGDMVQVSSGSSAGLWPIISGSSKMKVGG